MAVEHVHEHHEPEVVASGRPWIPGVAQLLCLASGIGFVVIGAVGLARSDIHHMTRDVAMVGPFRMTPLLAFIILGIGIIAIAGVADRATARAVGLVLGTALVALGIIALIQPVRALGWNEADGTIFLVAGGLLLLAGIVTPPYERTTTVI
ncbi:MAG: hypothetical protein ABR552_04055 [Actinomycetota bacterium]